MKTTLRVADVLERVNTMLSNDHNHINDSLELLMETILMDSGNYEGYRFNEDGGHKFYHVSNKLKAEYLTLKESRDERGCR